MPDIQWGRATGGRRSIIWPPDPTKDWRTVYFNFKNSTTAPADNSLLWNSNGNWQAPQPGSTSGYQIDYNAILNFINNVGPQVFPASLQSGRIVYYTQIPTSISTSTWPPTDLNQRFWKEYIDYVLGVMQVSSSSYVVHQQLTRHGIAAITGYGPDFPWGTVKITALSSLSQTSGMPYMHYIDNPKRPLLSFWFGPMTMIDFLGNYNLWYTGYGNNCSHFCWWPGTCHEAMLYACKLGVQGALSDIQNNHPNDMISLIMFCVPQSSATDTSGTRFNRVRVPLGQNYQALSESLWYPPATVCQGSTTTVTPYDANNLEVPRAMGGTCYAMPLMLAYNQFSCNSSLQTYNPAGTFSYGPIYSGDAGGNGRIGAQKIIIFETDGAPNTTASANFNNNGAYQSYYSVRYNSASPSGSEFPNNINDNSDNDSTVTSQITTLCTQLAAQSTAARLQHAQPPLADPLPCLRAAGRQRHADAGQYAARPAMCSTTPGAVRRVCRVTRSSTAPPARTSPTCRPRSRPSFKTASRCRSFSRLHRHDDPHSAMSKTCLDLTSNSNESRKSTAPACSGGNASTPCGR